MSREIKFRAWDSLSEVMIDWFTMTQTAYNREASCPLMYDIFTGRHDVELMQYTGLKDKKGVEIYEGDIVARSTEGSYPYEVVYCLSDTQAGWKKQRNENLTDIGLDHYGLEVIGNIYESPELLEGVK